MKNITELAGRALLGVFFLMGGLGKIGAGYAGTAGYMDAMGIPGSLLPLVIVLEIVGGLMILTGYKIKWAALALAGFTVVAAAIFHADFSNQMQSIMFMKNLAIAGGLLLFVSNGTHAWSIEKVFSK